MGRLLSWRKRPTRLALSFVGHGSSAPTPNLLATVSNAGRLTEARENVTYYSVRTCCSSCSGFSYAPRTRKKKKKKKEATRRAGLAWGGGTLECGSGLTSTS